LSGYQKSNKNTSNCYLHRIETTEIIATAARFVNNTNSNIFLTGKAGTGKTTFLRDLAEKTHKRFVIVAPTGIAALNAKGVTIHSQFLLPLGSFIPTRDPSGTVSDSGAFYTQNSLVRKHPLNSVRKQVLRDVDLLIIDEVSMLRADVLDAIDFRLKHARRNYNQPFGGVQVLMIGDLFQLPPIVRDHEWDVLRNIYRSVWFFEAQALQQSGFVYIELDKIFRQQGDKFIRILNNLRNNTPSEDDISELNKHFLLENEIGKLDEVVTLTTHNHKADKMNGAALQGLKTKEFIYSAELDGDFPPSMYPVEESISLKVGAQIMFIKNDSSDGAYFNGKLAKVVRLESDKIAVIMAGEKTEYVLKKEKWENRKYVLDETSKELEEDIVGSFTQYPVKLAWAITVHKSQGLTFDKAIIDVGQAFAAGQVYVALSRLRSLDGLILGTKISPSVISSDSNVTSFSQRKDEQPPLSELLDKAQQEYIERLLAQTFDFRDIIDQLLSIKKGAAAKTEFEDETMRAALDIIREAFEKEVANTNGFRSQLMRLLRDGVRDQLIERIEKGTAYYMVLIQKKSRLLLTHIAEVSQFSKTRTYLNTLEEVDASIVKKQTQIRSLQVTLESILDGKEIEPNKGFVKKISIERETMINAVAAEVKANPKFSKLKTGRKRKTSTGPKTEKGETYKKTLALFKEGQTIDDVAEKRGLSVGTIESHAAKLIAAGEIDIDHFMDKDDAQEIAKAIAKDSNESTSSVVGYLKGRFTYGQVRMVQAVIRSGS
jgi:type II secretory pathway predicted ATPase ExeA/DNA-binding NarL/FixJ family response regulator